MKDTYTTEITVTVPAGRFCNRKGYSCRFLVDSYNHPASYCFLISGMVPWENWHSPFRKHPDCPSLHQFEKRMKGETPDVLARLKKFQDLMK